jgi:hypothetical protein
VFDGAVALGGGAHHVTGGVLEKHERRSGLIAELDEVRRLGRTLWLDRAVVAEDAHQMAGDGRVTTDLAIAVVGAIATSAGASHTTESSAEVAGTAIGGGGDGVEMPASSSRAARARTNAASPQRATKVLEGKAGGVMQPRQAGARAAGSGLRSSAQAPQAGQRARSIPVSSSSRAQPSRVFSCAWSSLALCSSVIVGRPVARAERAWAKTVETLLGASSP